MINSHLCGCAACAMKRLHQAKVFDDGHKEFVKIIKKMKAEKDAKEQGRRGSDD